ncbi:MAG: PAS domain S-box protein, partial [Gammaproteobacteria bacterium]
MSDSKLLKELKAKIKELESRLQDHVIKQKELHSYKQQIDAMFDNAPVELYLKDREGRYLKINRHFEKIFGVRNEDLVGKLPSDAHKPELAESTSNQDMAVLSSGKVVRREEKVQLLTDSRIHTLLTIKFPIFDTEGRVDGLGAIATDITDQKLAEERFRDMVNTIDGIVWEAFTTENQFSYVSQQAVRFLGYSIEEWLVPGFWVEKMHPKDRDRVIENCRKSLTNGLDRFELEYRLIAKDGRIVWVRDLISVSREDDNQPLLRGVMIDITRQKEIEELTRSAENRFKTIYMAAPLGIVLTDLATGNLIESNPAYSRIIGRSMDEMKSLGWQAITHPDDLEQDLHQLKQMQEGRKTSYKFSKRFIKPDDSVVWVELTAVLISTEGDSRSQYLAILEDITERRQFEERIWQQANYDLLTGLPNRNMLQDRLEQLIKKEKRGGLEFALLLIDLDQFKEVNDTLGH